MEKTQQIFEKIIKIRDEYWDSFSSRPERREFPKKSLVLKIG